MNTFSKRKKVALFILSLLFCYAVEVTASFFTQSSVGSWYVSLEKPFWNPPNLAFPVVWTALYTMMGVSLWKILCEPKAYFFKVFLAFFVQIFLNFTWSFAFFYMQSPSLGLFNIVLLLLAIMWNIYVFSQHSKTAARLLIPYFLWVGYASSLNLAIWYLN
ncbi:MAG: benzodiazapine receptor [Chlamydiales bacterium]|jgi:benzodiazapine receptor